MLTELKTNIKYAVTVGIDKQLCLDSLSAAMNINKYNISIRKIALYYIYDTEEFT